MPQAAQAAEMFLFERANAPFQLAGKETFWLTRKGEHNEAKTTGGVAFPRGGEGIPWASKQSEDADASAEQCRA